MKTSKLIHALAILGISPFFVWACKEGGDVLPEDTPTINTDDKSTIVVNITNESFIPLVETSAYNLNNRNLNATYNEKSNYFYTYVKQDGKLIDCGKAKATVSSDKKVMTSYYNESKKVNTSMPHEVYLTQKAPVIHDNKVYYKSNLHRTGTFYSCAKASVTKGGGTCMAEPNGTYEVTYITNSTDKPINFKHKGFKAAELWYYESAEVSMDDHSVINGKAVSQDSISNDVSVGLLSENKWTRIVSFYPPNGKKIQNATLVAEIDGKEVQTSNTLSSDLTIQPGKGYCYVVDWDGKELKFVKDVKVIDMSNPHESGIDVVGYSDEDNALVIKSSQDKVPEVGEYIVSGITDDAPCGFLLKANSVHDCGDGAYLIYTEPATLHEVLKAKGVEYKGWLSIDSDNSATRATDVLDESIKKDPIIKMPLEFKIKDKTAGEGKFTLNEELYFVEKDCGIYIDSENESNQGFNWTFLQTETWNVSGKWNAFDFDIKDGLAESNSKIKWYKQYTVGYINGIPVVITPKFEIKVPINMNLAIDANMDIKKSSYLHHVGAKWDGGPQPIFSNGSYLYSEEVAIPDDKLPQSQQTHMQMTASGSASVKWVFSASVGLYGGNLTDEERIGLYTKNAEVKKYIKQHTDNEFKVSYLTLGADFTIGASAKVRLGFEGPGNNSPARYHNDNRMIDDISLKLSADMKVKLLAWEIKSDLINWKCEKESELGSWSLFNISFPLLFKDFTKIKLATLEDGRIKVTGTVKHPLLNPMGWISDYGICIERYGLQDYKAMPLEDKDIKGGLFTSKFEYILPWKVNELQSGATYTIYPYVKLVSGIIYRKGITFIPTSSGLKYNSIDDVPGENF